MLCNGWVHRLPGVSDGHSPGSASSMQVPWEHPSKQQGDASPKQLLCLWSEKESIWLKNCWITKDNHRITRGTGKDHQGHRAQSPEDWSLHHHFASKPTFKKLMHQKKRKKGVPPPKQRFNLQSLQKDLLPTHQIFTLTPVWTATYA